MKATIHDIFPVFEQISGPLIRGLLITLIVLTIAAFFIIKNRK